MPRKGHSPEQVLNKLRQVEVAVAGGRSVGHAVREIGVTDQKLADSSNCSDRYVRKFEKEISGQKCITINRNLYSLSSDNPCPSN